MVEEEEGEGVIREIGACCSCCFCVRGWEALARRVLKGSYGVSNGIMEEERYLER